MKPENAQKIAEAVMRLLADGKAVTVAAISRESGFSARTIQRWKAATK